MSKKTQALKPNRLQLAIQELNGIVPEKHIKSTINLGESKGYVFIGVKHRDNARGTAKDHFMKVLYAPINKYEEMKKTKHLYGGLFNGMFGTLVILHDPTKPMAVEESTDQDGTIEGEPFQTKGRMSDAKKLAINKLMEEGKGEDDKGLNEIAKEVDVSFAKVKEYIKSF